MDSLGAGCLAPVCPWGPKPLPLASLSLRGLLMPDCALNRGHGTMGNPSPLRLPRNNGDSWREGSESINRIVKGWVLHGPRVRGWDALLEDKLEGS